MSSTVNFALRYDKCDCAGTLDQWKNASRRDQKTGSDGEHLLQQTFLTTNISDWKSPPSILRVYFMLGSDAVLVPWMFFRLANTKTIIGPIHGAIVAATVAASDRQNDSCNRRGCRSETAALICCCDATFCNHRHHPGFYPEFHTRRWRQKVGSTSLPLPPIPPIPLHPFHLLYLLPYPLNPVRESGEVLCALPLKRNLRKSNVFG